MIPGDAILKSDQFHSDLLFDKLLDRYLSPDLSFLERSIRKIKCCFNKFPFTTLVKISFSNQYRNRVELCDLVISDGRSIVYYLNALPKGRKQYPLNYTH